MNYLTNPRVFDSYTNESIDTTVRCYGGGTLTDVLTVYTTFHNETTIEDLPVKYGAATHFRIYFPEKRTSDAGIQFEILDRDSKVLALMSMIRVYFGQSVGFDQAKGFWVGKDGDVVTENIVRVEWWDDCLTKSRLQSILTLCQFLKERLGQDAIGLEIDSKLFVCV